MFDLKERAWRTRRVNLPIIGKLLGRANATTTARYARLDADPLRRASERIGSTIAAAMGDGAVPGSAKIIRLRN